MTSRRASQGGRRPQPRSAATLTRTPYPATTLAPSARDLTGEFNEPEASRAFTPFRITLFLAILGALALIAYGVFVERGGAQIPILVGGLALMGLALLGLSVSAAIAIIRAGRAGAGGRALGAALFGGVCALAAAASLASAVAFGLIWGSVRS